MLKNVQNGACSSIFHYPICSYKHFYNLHKHFLPLYLTYFSLPYFYIQPSLQSPQKVYSSTTEPIQTATMVQRAMTFCGDWHFWSLPDFLKHGQGEKCSKSLSPYWSESENAVLQVVASVEDTSDQNSKLSTRPSPISTYHDFHTLLTSS